LLSAGSASEEDSMERHGVCSNALLGGAMEVNNVSMVNVIIILAIEHLLFDPFIRKL
jgi:hypothetical protein